MPSRRHRRNVATTSMVSLIGGQDPDPAADHGCYKVKGASNPPRLFLSGIPDMSSPSAGPSKSILL